MDCEVPKMGFLVFLLGVIRGGVRYLKNASQHIFVAGNATYKSLCRSICPSVHLSVGPSVHRSVGPSVRRSVCPSVGPSHFTFFLFLSYLKVEKLRYEYFMDITAPAQPPTTGAAVYTALLDATTHLS